MNEQTAAHKPAPESAYPRHDEIREAMLDRAREYGRRTGMSMSDISKAAVNDTAFLTQIMGGRNFTINIYKKFMSYLDANWPADE